MNTRPNEISASEQELKLKKKQKTNLMNTNPPDHKCIMNKLKTSEALTSEGIYLVIKKRYGTEIYRTINLFKPKAPDLRQNSTLAKLFNFYRSVA